MARPNKFLLSIGLSIHVHFYRDGQCWDIGDAAALWELGEVRKGLYSSGESKKFYYHF